MANSEHHRLVIHLLIKATGEHYYFGSISAMYDYFSSSQLGIAQQSLYNRWKDEPWINEKVEIRKGRLLPKRKNR